MEEIIAEAKRYDEGTFFHEIKLSAAFRMITALAERVAEVEKVVNAPKLSNLQPWPGNDVKLPEVGK